MPNHGDGSIHCHSVQACNGRWLLGQHNVCSNVQLMSTHGVGVGVSVCSHTCRSKHEALHADVCSDQPHLATDPRIAITRILLKAVSVIKARFIL